MILLHPKRFKIALKGQRGQSQRGVRSGSFWKALYWLVASSVYISTHSQWTWYFFVFNCLCLWLCICLYFCIGHHWVIAFKYILKVILSRGKFPNSLLLPSKYTFVFPTCTLSNLVSKDYQAVSVYGALVSGNTQTQLLGAEDLLVFNLVYNYNALWVNLFVSEICMKT